MSLFICSNCGTVENHSTINRNNNKKFPNMHLMDMHGCGGSFDLSVIKPNWIKTSDEIVMLCSECNSGEWHNEFPKGQATDIEKAYAELSEYNYCTQFDHDMSFDEFERQYKKDNK